MNAERLSGIRQLRFVDAAVSCVRRNNAQGSDGK